MCVKLLDSIQLKNTVYHESEHASPVFTWRFFFAYLYYVAILHYLKGSEPLTGKFIPSFYVVCKD